jgi:hypothetical protein
VGVVGVVGVVVVVGVVGVVVVVGAMAELLVWRSRGNHQREPSHAEV